MEPRIQASSGPRRRACSWSSALDHYADVRYYHPEAMSSPMWGTVNRADANIYNIGNDYSTHGGAYQISPNGGFER